MSHASPNGDLACNAGVCPDWGSNQRPFDSQACAQSTEPYQSGQCPPFIPTWFYSILGSGGFPRLFVFVSKHLQIGERGQRSSGVQNDFKMGVQLINDGENDSKQVSPHPIPQATVFLHSTLAICVFVTKDSRWPPSFLLTLPSTDHFPGVGQSITDQVTGG